MGLHCTLRSGYLRLLHESGTMNKDGSQWLPRPAAVVLPQSTMEVQEIMHFCSNSQYMAKPLSTGFHTAAAASNKNVIILDLKRMNRIIDIDYKNQIAVIEPYVRAIDLQTEIVKHGLNCHIISSGANHSLLASHAAAWGYGSQALLPVSRQKPAGSGMGSS